MAVYIYSLCFFSNFKMQMFVELASKYGNSQLFVFKSYGREKTHLILDIFVRGEVLPQLRITDKPIHVVIVVEKAIHNRCKKKCVTNTF